MEGRVRSSGFAKMAIDEGFCTKEELAKMASGWEEFRQNQDAWFGLLHGEIICLK